MKNIIMPVLKCIGQFDIEELEGICVTAMGEGLPMEDYKDMLLKSQTSHDIRKILRDFGQNNNNPEYKKLADKFLNIKIKVGNGFKYYFYQEKVESGKAYVLKVIEPSRIQLRLLTDSSDSFFPKQNDPEKYLAELVSKEIIPNLIEKNAKQQIQRARNFIKNNSINLHDNNNMILKGLIDDLDEKMAFGYGGKYFLDEFYNQSKPAKYKTFDEFKNNKNEELVKSYNQDISWTTESLRKKLDEFCTQ